MLAGVTDCRRTWRMDTGPGGFGREGRENHAALAEWGPHGGNTAEGARNLNQTSTSFPEIRYPRMSRGRRKDCVHL